MIETSPIGNRVTGFYRGIVKAHSDFGRCKIFWPGCMPEEYNSDDKIQFLPDAEQATSIFMFGPGKNGFSGNGVFCYPEIGSIVWGFFENENINHPVYFASTVVANKENANLYKDLSANKQKSVFNLNTNDGNLTITINDEDNWITLKSEKKLLDKTFNSSISISKYGGIDIDAPHGNVTINAMNISLNAANTLSLHSDKIAHMSSGQQTRVESRGNVGIVGRFGIWLRGFIGRRTIF